VTVTLAEADFAWVRGLVRSESGMVIEEEKRYLVEARLKAVARGEGTTDVSALLREARRPGAGDLRDRVVQGVLIGETQFFRDGHPFEALRRHVLPDLIRAREAERALSIWCAASASGQEPYSLAMVLAEDFPRLAGWRVRLLASDLSDRMLARAKEGLYSPAEIGRGLPPEALERWFEKHEGGWLLAEAIRRRVELRRINLVGEWPSLPRMDLVLLRNVLIYLDAASRAGIVRRVHDLLRPGGTLFLGTSESLDLGAPGFEQVRYGRTICWRRTGP
jgi:chemotaxis protein methyltransferase CheR